MERNFKIKQGVEVWWGSKFVDLHNLYDFCDIVFSQANDMLTIVFRRNQFEVPKDLEIPKQVLFVFSGLQHLQVNDDLLHNRKLQLEEIGYKSPGDYNLDWLTTEDKSKEEDHIILRFQEDEFIRIGCDKAFFQ